MKMFEILEKWQQTIVETDYQVERLQNFLGIVSCDLTNAYEKLQIEYTHAIAEKIGDTGAHWLLWFWLDNGMGKKELGAGYDGNINPVTGLHALEDLIVEGAKRKGVAE